MSDGIVVVAVWRSRERFRAFVDKLLESEDRNIELPSQNSSRLCYGDIFFFALAFELYELNMGDKSFLNCEISNACKFATLLRHMRLELTNNRLLFNFRNCQMELSVWKTEQISLNIV